MSNQQKNPMRAMALMSSILSTLAGSILIGIFGGKWIDSMIGTFPLFLVIGLFLGLGTGVYGTIRLISNFESGEKQ